MNSSSLGSFCCSLLSTIPSLSPILSFSGATTYQSTLSSYTSLQESLLLPTCILTPTTPSQVSTAISLLSSHPSCQFAIKSHGHAVGAGFANIASGVTISLTSLSSISVNGDRTVASVGAGARWLDVYAELDKYGIQVAGGRNGNVGVGGLLLGGGISYFGPRVGWACDNVVNFEVVLPSGLLVNANAISHSDLFRALKGGANNFGVVTRFDLAAFPQGEILAGAISTTIENVDAVFEAFAEIAGAEDYDPYASLVTGLTFSSDAKAWVGVGTTAIYTKSVENPKIYEEFLSIPDTTSTQHLTNLSTFSNETQTPPLDWMFYTSTYGVSAPLLSRIFSSLNETMYEFDIPGGITWSVAFEPLPTVFTKWGDLKGGNSLGTTPKDGNAFVLLLAGIWNNTSSNDLVEGTGRQMIEDIAEIAVEMGLLHEFQYLNYADPSQDPIGSYGEENASFLREVSKKYDPKGVFQRQVPGGFKLGL